MSGRILVVEDDERIRSSMRLALEGEGYEVRDAASGEEGLDMFAEAPPDVALIDLMLPGMDGFECCRALRRSSAVPIIIVTARADTHDVVAGLEAGADDYVTKPFGIQELLARVRAHLRRAPERTASAMETGDFVLDVNAHSISVLGRPIHLTPKEFDLLIHLARHAGKVMTHRALLTEVWGAQSAHQPEYLRVFVGQVRKKLEAETGKQYIQTEPWVGYRFIPEGWSGEEA